MTKRKKKTRSEKTEETSGRKRIIKVVLPAVLVLAFAVGALLWALPNLPVRPQTQSGATYKGVLELWNVECFEGGVGSRESWLKGRAARFEKLHEGLFVHVNTFTVEQLQSKLSAGDSFDLICFSRGAGCLVQDRLAACDVDVGAVKTGFALSGQINGKQYAVPLFTGAYCLFARAEMLSADKLVSEALSRTYTRTAGKSSVTLAPLVCGFTPYNSPLSALAMSGGRGKADVSDQVTQYEAYEKFVANRTAVTLLGTQRDMYRLSQKESNGRIEQLAFAPLNGYTDLVQYLGICAQSDNTEACEDFARYLLSEQCQSSLVNLYMFSVLEQKFYTAERYSQCEEALSLAYVPNVFGDGDAVARQRQVALETLSV